MGKKWGKTEDFCSITDSLTLARHKHPGQKNSLDALCKRYEVDNSQRDLHGALLDAQILVDVYLVMTGGQTDLGLLNEVRTNKQGSSNNEWQIPTDRNALPVIAPTEEEMSLHQSRLQQIAEITGQISDWEKVSAQKSRQG